MSSIVVLGEHPRIDGFALSGVELVSVDGPDAVRRAWERLPDDGIVILTPAAAAALEGVEGPLRRLRVVMPS
ncbi:MAG: hypothetical protein ACXWCM_13920 [Acidimicrobiales bacterium]